MNGISVIIPIYNVQDYIEECLKSVIKSMEGFSNIQIILVDDGSKDLSGNIAQGYVRQHSNFEYVYKENGGLSDARNFGLQFVKNDYVTFLDSDDYIAENYFFEVFQSLHGQPEMIIFDWEDVGDDNYTNYVNGMDLPEFIWTVQPSAWNKVYKTALFNKVKFPKGMIYEDVGTIYKLIWFVKDYKYINKPLYKYRKNRQGSILTTISPRINDIYKVLEDTYLFYIDNNAFTGKNVEGLCYQYVKILLWPNMYRQLKYYKFNFVGFYKKMKVTRKLVYSNFSNWKDNTYLLQNTSYFANRFGENYIKKMDYLGEGFFITILTVMSLILRNFKKK